MKSIKITHTLVLCFIMAIPFFSKAQQITQISKGYWVACGDDKVLIINPAVGSDSSAIIWKWQCRSDTGGI